MEAEAWRLGLSLAAAGVPWALGERRGTRGGCHEAQWRRRARLASAAKCRVAALERPCGSAPRAEAQSARRRTGERMGKARRRGAGVRRAHKPLHTVCRQPAVSSQQAAADSLSHCQAHSCTASRSRSSSRSRRVAYALAGRRAATSHERVRAASECLRAQHCTGGPQPAAHSLQRLQSRPAAYKAEQGRKGRQQIEVGNEKGSH